MNFADKFILNKLFSGVINIHLNTEDSWFWWISKLFAVPKSLETEITYPAVKTPANMIFVTLASH